MASNIKVRASRAGDQFHYRWAARRALHLLDSRTDLVALSIEGSSPTETEGSLEAGEEVIDVAEYYGDAEPANAACVRYMQLKHSTLQADQDWQPSGLEKTISGFAEKFTALKNQLSLDHIAEKIEFWFVTNRGINAQFVEATEDAAENRIARHPESLEKLKKFTNLDGADLAAFCKALHYEGRQDDYWEQRNILSAELNRYLAAADSDASLRIVDLVSRKALPESANNPTITKIDILRVLGTEEPDLFPANCQIVDLPNAVPRAQESELISAILASGGNPVIISADAGVGKSILSTRIAKRLPAQSIHILFDGFANGSYRTASLLRHRHRVALVQIVNELAAQGLCYPLIPMPHVDTTTYLRAFHQRLEQSVAVIKARHKDAVLCITVDAADNAQMAAEELSEPRSFIRDLIRESLPQGVYLVVLCRPYRIDMLDPPPTTVKLQLESFNWNESAAHLRQRFSEASNNDVNEFHRLSSQNPRVQALALSKEGTLPEILRVLGPNPKNVDDTINSILEESIAKLKESEAGSFDKPQIDAVCAGLAVLRPLIPIAVLSSISGVSEAAIKSFILEMGRPLLLQGDSIQFLDEPSETWFRERFRPAAGAFAPFLDKLKPLSAGSAYVASTLPQLMLEAGQFAELIELALDSQGLPETSPVEKRDVAMQRLSFALKASLRSQNYLAAAKLALKAGGESAGNNRQATLLQENTDLVSLFFDANSVQEIVSRRVFGSGWKGSNHVYEAALLSGHEELLGDARSRLRMAEEWLRNWATLPDDERQQEPVTDEDRTIMALAHLNVHGPAAAARSLRCWTDREVSYNSGRQLARILIDHSRFADLDELAIAAENDLGLLLALALENRRAHRLLPIEPTRRALKLLLSRRIKVGDPHSHSDIALSAITALTESALRHNLCDATQARSLLERYIPETPPYGITDRFGGTRSLYLRAYALHAALSGVQLELTNLASDKLKKEIEEKRQHGDSQELSELKRECGALLPWFNLWAKTFLNPLSKEQLDIDIEEAKSITAKAEGYSYDRYSHSSNEIANIRLDILVEASEIKQSSIADILEWPRTRSRQIFTGTINRLAQVCSTVDETKAYAIELSQSVYSMVSAERDDARVMSEGYVAIARSLLRLSPDEAKAYFNRAIEDAGKIGDENLVRWDALIELAVKAAHDEVAKPQLAYKFSRCAEVTRHYVDRDKHFRWFGTMKALAGLCPSSLLAIISRWRDRGFGNEYRILANATEALIARGHVSPKEAAPLFSYRAWWNVPALLTGALSSCSSVEEKQVLLAHLYKYAALEHVSPDTMKAFSDAYAKAGITRPDTLPELLGLAERKDSEEHNYRHSIPDEASSNEKSWGQIFLNVDVMKAAELIKAYQEFKAGEPPFTREAFFREAIKRVPAGKEVAFVAALEPLLQVDEYMFRSFSDVYPPEWKSRISMKTAMAALIKNLCRYFSLSIRKSEWYQPFPLAVAAELSGLSEAELVGVILGEIGLSGEISDSDEYFSIVVLLTEKLSCEEAVKALEYGLSLFETVLQETDGEGPWSDDITPPESVASSFAGYVWAGLASPDSGTRWESAHAVVGLCALNCTEMLAKLFEHATKNTSMPFVCRGFQFYELHARQWFLIGLERAALSYGKLIAPYKDYLSEQLNTDHVLMRLFASRALQRLSDIGVIEIDAVTKQRIEQLNISPFDPASETSVDGSDDYDDLQEEEDGHFFGIDFGPYWLAPLGRCFGFSERKIERKTLKYLRETFSYRGGHFWQEDARRNQSAYADGTQHSHGSSPKVDDLGFYLSYHAMFITAGKLLASKPLVNGEYEWDRDRFSEWLSGHDLTRRDGRWLADRRDPSPPIFTDRLKEDDGEEWVKSIHRESFDCIVNSAAQDIVVWGHWTKIDSSCEEDISVNSALVSPTRAFSLLRALQTAKDPYDFRIPDAEDDLQIEHGEFRLKGWITARSSEKRLDELDPWAGMTRYPMPEPAGYVIDTMQLEADSDRRNWVEAGSDAFVAVSRTWGKTEERGEIGQPDGSWLRVKMGFIQKLLTKLQMDLLVVVQVRRRKRYRHYSAHDDSLNISASFRIFLVKSDGTVHTL